MCTINDDLGGYPRRVSDTGYGDFEFERRFWARDVPADLLDASPALIVQSYVLADAGFAIRVRVQATVEGLVLEPGLDELAILDRYADQMDFCAITVKGPMNEGTRYEAERELDVSVGHRAGPARRRPRGQDPPLGLAGRRRLGGRHVRGRQRAADDRRGGARRPGHRPDHPRLLRHRGDVGPAVLQRRAGGHALRDVVRRVRGRAGHARSTVPGEPRAQPPRGRAHATSPSSGGAPGPPRVAAASRQRPGPPPRPSAPGRAAGRT